MDTNKSHEISLQDAIDMTTRYKNNQPVNMALSETIEAAAIQKLLATPGCKSLRIYYGRKESNDIHAILVAVDSSNKDILPSGNSLDPEEDEPIILEDLYRCPPVCDEESPLNPKNP